MIYQPAEDSYLLQKKLKEYLENVSKSIIILDMGSGSGIQAKTCKELGFKNITAADINPEAISHLKSLDINPILTDLFSNLYKGGLRKGTLVPLQYDLIIFNPPYLPEDSREPEDSKLATTGGKEGYEIINKFLEQSKSHLSSQGTILLLISSLSKPEIIKQKAKELDYRLEQIDSQKIDFEELLIYKLTKHD